MSSSLSRSFLFVPASRPERFDKAAASGAHQVILDLEDAVAPADKETARGFIAQWMGRADAIVRVNGADSPFFIADMEMIRRAGVTKLMLPKAEPGALNRLVGLLEGQCDIIALIETVRGYAELRSIGKSGLVSQLAFGNLDFGIDAGVTETAQELDPVRLQIVLESRLAGLAPPIDGVTTSWTDPAAFGAAVGRTKALGFGAKLCIHPAQVKLVNEAFLPTADELDWARRVIQAAKDGQGAAVALDGKMIDAPVIRRAELILAGASGSAT
ncbi:CoA ester lyase [Bradyrhizobium sp. OK095]|uniref:HpcH/HpaI aldolase/citrate lyase family protein n=1 Tax=Bradyrhizobium sp. OK095 TaxID=1882760 RepID=UPI0008C9C0BF|nr:CoA ester lyase [Bradyrhizobium sp. OK095]SEM26210.1 citrate lyase subunit beta / citryl-CoA lyase [Bradyrhizobium sp. OK095]